MSALHRTRNLGGPVLLATFVLVTASCGDGGPDAIVTIDEYAIHFDVDEFEIPAESRSLTSTDVIELEVDNVGTLSHELVLVRRQDYNPGELPLAADGRVDEDIVLVVDRVTEFEPGAYDTGIPAIQAGEYVVYCNLLDDDGSSHYQQGMWTEVSIVLSE